MTQCLSFLVKNWGLLVFFTESDVCKLQVSCPAFSRCITEYISSSFPPASYYCTCDPGYEPSVRRPGNFIFSHEKCVKQTPGKFVMKIIIQRNIKCWKNSNNHSVGKTGASPIHLALLLHFDWTTISSQMSLVRSCSHDVTPSKEDYETSKKISSAYKSLKFNIFW